MRSEVRHGLAGLALLAALVACGGAGDGAPGAPSGTAATTGGDTACLLSLRIEGFMKQAGIT